MKGLSLFSPPPVSSLPNLQVTSGLSSAEYEQQLQAKYRLRIQQIRSEAKTPVLKMQDDTWQGISKTSFAKQLSPEEGKINELLQWVGSIPFEDARALLSSNEWSVEAAVKAFFASDNSSSIQVEFMLPKGASFKQRFEKQEVLWGCLQAVYSKLNSDQKFSIKQAQGGREFSYEEMSSITFGSFGVNRLTLWVEF